MLSSHPPSSQEVGPASGDSGAGPSYNPRAPGDKPDMIVIILCVFIPCLGVYIFKNKCCNEVCIALLLSLLFGFPGIIYALWIVGCCGHAEKELQQMRKEQQEKDP